jgi:hypothetical protein
MMDMNDFHGRYDNPIFNKLTLQNSNRKGGNLLFPYPCSKIQTDNWLMVYRQPIFTVWPMVGAHIQNHIHISPDTNFDIPTFAPQKPMGKHQDTMGKCQDMQTVTLWCQENPWQSTKTLGPPSNSSPFFIGDTGMETAKFVPVPYTVR